jgi:hypothetical protein
MVTPTFADYVDLLFNLSHGYKSPNHDEENTVKLITRESIDIATIINSSSTEAEYG